MRVCGAFIVILLFLGAARAQPQNQPADLVVINAQIRTIVSANAKAEAVAVIGDRFSAVGTNSQIRRLIGPKTRVIDAKGKLVLPGFNDAHVHFMAIGNSFSSIDLRNAKTPADIEKRIARYVQFLPKGRWVLGGGWTVEPDKLSIDNTAPDNPIFIYSSDGLSAFANTLARKLGGLKSDVSEGNGIIRGDSMRRVAHAVPADHTRRWPEIAETATNYAASLGVTSVQDMHSDDSRAVYREIHRQGKLKTRVYDCLPLPDWKKLADPSALSDNSEMVRGGCLKSFSDGDEEQAPKLLRDIVGADKAGLQIMVHAIGYAANKIVLDGFEQAARSNGHRDRRFRVEHAHNPRETDVSRFARSEIIPSMQPHLFYGSNGGYYASLVKQKASLAFGSDAAITDFNPILGVHAAVNAGAESISVYDAVRAYTRGSAYAEFREAEKGTIEIGKLADFVILSDDIFAVPIAGIRLAHVTTTCIGGRIVFGD